MFGCMYAPGRRIQPRLAQAVALLGAAGWPASSMPLHLAVRRACTRRQRRDPPRAGERPPDTRRFHRASRWGHNTGPTTGTRTPVHASRRSTPAILPAGLGNLMRPGRWTLGSSPHAQISSPACHGSASIGAVDARPGACSGGWSGMSLWLAGVVHRPISPARPSSSARNCEMSC